MVDYLTKNLWDTLLPQQLRQDLMDLPRDQLQYLPTAFMGHETATGKGEWAGQYELLGL